MAEFPFFLPVCWQGRDPATRPTETCTAPTRDPATGKLTWDLPCGNTYSKNSPVQRFCCKKCTNNAINLRRQSK